MSIQAGADVTLRRLEKEDLPLTLKWRNQERVRSSFHDSNPITMEQHLAWYDRYLGTRDTVFIISHEEIPVGQVSIYNVSAGYKIAEFGRLMIGSDAHLGKGIAKRASEAAVNFALGIGVQWLHLSVKKGNHAAISIYRSLGFSDRGTLGGSLLMGLRSSKFNLSGRSNRFAHSVILGSYNRPKLVRQAIESVARQTVQDFQLIVTDDGSNEETLDAIVESLMEIDPEKVFLLVATDRGGKDNCFNRAVHRINDAIQVAEGRIIHYLADDDWYHEERFAHFDEAFKDPSVMVAYGRELFADAAGNLTGGGIYYPSVVDPLNVLDHNQVAHRSEVFEVYPKWRDAIDMASDGHWFRDLSKLWRFHAFDKVVAYKRFHDHCMQRTGMASGARRES